MTENNQDDLWNADASGGELFDSAETEPDLFGEKPASQEPTAEENTTARPAVATKPASDVKGEHPTVNSVPTAKAQVDGYVVIARKYRPQTFDDIVGQEGVQQALRGAIATGQIAHSYLFSGPRGTGKTSTARILAKAVNCMDNGPRPDPCGKCSSCRSITNGSSLDVIEIDAASNTGVDNIRELKSGVVLAPFSRYKVYIVDEVHMLSNQAFNALLKTLEEPPPQVIFVLATTELHKVPETIISRCQTFMFRRFSLDELKNQLGNILDIEMAARQLDVDTDDREKILDLIARNAEGGMRDAQVTLDQVLVLSKGTINFEAVRRFLGMADTAALDQFIGLLHGNDSKGLLELIDTLVTNGQDLELFVKGACEHMRDLLLIKCAGADTTLINVSEDRGKELEKLAAGLPAQFIVNAVDHFLKVVGEMKVSGQPRIVLELAALKLTLNKPAAPIDEIIDRLDSLEKRLEGSSTSRPAKANTVVKESPNTTSYSAESINPVHEISSITTAEPSNVHMAESEVVESNPSPIAAGGLENFSNVGEMIAALKQRIKSEAPMLTMSFEKGLCDQEFDSKILTLFINSAQKMASSQIMRGANSEIICRIAKELFGDNVLVRFQSKEGETSPSALTLGVTKEESETEEVRQQEAPTAKNLALVSVEKPGKPDQDEALKIYYPEEIREKTMISVKDSEFQHMLETDTALRELVEKTKRVFGIDDKCLKFHRSTLA